MALIGYVLLTFGAKHTSLPLAERPGAAAQMEQIHFLAAEIKGQVDHWYVDHARSPIGPVSLPTLFAILKVFEEHEGSGAVIIDDVTRLFRKLSPDARTALLTALKPYHQLIIDARQKRRLSSLTNTAWVALLRAALNKPAVGTKAKKDQRRTGSASTKMARRVSSLVRAKSADHLAVQILELRGEFAGAGSAPSNVVLARVANERGLRTTRGNFWSDVAVARAIKRISKPPDDT